MRVIVEVRSGPTRGHRIIVRSGQVIQFGRTERADMVFPHDDGLSGVHFAIEAAEGRCLLRDLASTNGTQLNHQFVTEAVIRDGDTVMAGNTQFQISIEGGALAAKADEAPGPGIVRDTSRIVLDPSLARPSYRVETCSSGLTLITGVISGGDREPAAISSIAAPLAERFPCYLIVDFKKAGLPFPEPSGASIPLFDWLPPDVAAVNSPLIITPAATIDRSALLDAAWDQDVAVVIFSPRPTEPLVQHLRDATRLNLDGSMPVAGQRKGLLGYCWPSVLAPLLAFRTPAFVQSLLSGIDAVLIEIPDLPGTWQIYCGKSFVAAVAKMGFQKVIEDDLANA